MREPEFPLPSSSTASLEFLSEDYIKTTTKRLSLSNAHIWSNLLWRNHSQTCIPIQVIVYLINFFFLIYILKNVFS